MSIPTYSRTAPVADPNGTESEVNGQGGGAGGISASTRMNTAALGGFNPNIILSHQQGIQKGLSNISEVMKSKSVKAPAKMSQHLDTIQSHVNALKAHVSKVQSESDDGDMSHYDPTGGTGHQI